jgi:hypothetical protein
MFYLILLPFPFQNKTNIQKSRNCQKVDLASSSIVRPKLNEAANALAGRVCSVELCLFYGYNLPFASFPNTGYEQTHCLYFVQGSRLHVFLFLLVLFFHGFVSIEEEE